MNGGRRRNGFTLIELLVVMAIISMLAGQMLPALAGAREKGRQANCINNLKQFSLAIEMYRNDFINEFPCWLSNLYPSYLSSRKVYVCLSDLNDGTAGHGNPTYPETADYSGNTDPDPAIGLRNSQVEACSYFYEFNAAQCDWWESSYGTTGDLNGNGIVSWKEAKRCQMTGVDGVPAITAYFGHVPIVRCFWHYYTHDGPVLNLAVEDYNVYLSDAFWETTSR
ncbi:MAG TPA: type II secretion system protein [bacterium]|nr:type II secretion system protein [bacterium]HNS48885.1 type II secretion system protein [bacterium]